MLTFSLTVTDPFGLTDTDTTGVGVALPELSISKSGPSAVKAGTPVTYTLTITNSAPVAATSLVITDALPIGATFVTASDGGTLDAGIVSWTVPSLGPTDWLSRTFTVTATATITNSVYGISCDEGIAASGSVSVVTSFMRTLYLPLILRNY